MYMYDDFLEYALSLRLSLWWFFDPINRGIKNEYEIIDKWVSGVLHSIESFHPVSSIFMFS